MESAMTAGGAGVPWEEQAVSCAAPAVMSYRPLEDVLASCAASWPLESLCGRARTIARRAV